MRPAPISAALLLIVALVAYAEQKASSPKTPFESCASRVVTALEVKNALFQDKPKGERLLTDLRRSIVNRLSYLLSAENGEAVAPSNFARLEADLQAYTAFRDGAELVAMVPNVMARYFSMRLSSGGFPEIEQAAVPALLHEHFEKPLQRLRTLIESQNGTARGIQTDLEARRETIEAFGTALAGISPTMLESLPRPGRFYQMVTGLLCFKPANSRFMEREWSRLGLPLLLESMIPFFKRNPEYVREIWGILSNWKKTATEPKLRNAAEKAMKSQESTKSIYEVLGLPRTASDAEVKRAWRDFAKNSHPDLFKGKGPQAEAEATKEFQKKKALFDVLLDPAKKASYDATLD